MYVAYKNTQISYVLFFVFPNCMFNVQCKNRKLLLFSQHNTTEGKKFGRGYWNTNFTKSNKNIGLKHLGTAPHTGKKVHARYRQS